MPQAPSENFDARPFNLATNGHRLAKMTLPVETAEAANAKIVVMLVSSRTGRPELAAKVPTTDAAAATGVEWARHLRVHLGEDVADRPILP